MYYAAFQRILRLAPSMVGAFVCLGLAQLASSADRVVFPDEQPVIPAYARFETVSDLGFTDRVWFVIPFYRDPACVPRDFNLLDFLDSPRAWECDDLIPPYIEGFAIRSQPLPAPPEHFFASGLDGMPVWFVAFDELQDVATKNRGTITIKDLKKMGSLRTGVADFYVEEIQTGVNPVSSHRIVTRGKLLDGTSFLAVYSHGSATDVPKIQAIIQFGP
jgi:hypothetical protein